MCHKVFAIIFIILAVIMGLAVTFMPQESLMPLYNVSRFIEIMIPVLAVGALIKYLFSCNKNCTKN